MGAAVDAADATMDTATGATMDTATGATMDAVTGAATGAAMGAAIAEDAPIGVARAWGFPYPARPVS